MRDPSSLPRDGLHAPHIDGTHIGIFESLQLEVSNVEFTVSLNNCVDGYSDCAIYAQ